PVRRGDLPGDGYPAEHRPVQRPPGSCGPRPGLEGDVMTPIEDKLRAAIRARADEIEPYAPPLLLPPRRRRSFFLAHGGGGKRRTPAQRVWQGWGAPAASAIMVGVVIVASAVIFGGHSASSSPVRSSAERVTHAA